MSGIEETIIEGLLSNATAYAEDAAFSWIVTGILGQGAGSDDQAQILANLGKITADLATMSAQLSDLQTEVANLIAALYAISDYEGFVQPLNTGYPTLVGQITDDYKTLQGLTSTDTAEAQSLVDLANTYNIGLDTLCQLMTGTFPTLAGDLMGAVAEYNGVRLVGAAGYDPTDPAPLLAAYQAMEDFCHGIFTLEVKALALATNAFLGSGSNGEPDLSQAAANQFSTTLTAQCNCFIAAVEALATTYHPDGTLLDMLGAGPSADIIRLAHDFTNAYLGNAGQTMTTSRVWMWSGSGPDFSTGAFNQLEVVLDGSKSSYVPATVVQTDFSDGNGNLWTRTRCDFPQLPSDSYSCGVPTFANALINPGNASNIFLAASTSVAFTLGGGAGADSAILTTTTSLTAAGGDDSYATLSTDLNLLTYTLETWVYVMVDGFLFSSGGANTTPGTPNPGFVVYVSQGLAYLYAQPASEPTWTASPLSVSAPIAYGWHHVAVTFDVNGTGGTLYVDSLSYPFTWPGQSAGLPLQYLHVGYDPGQVAPGLTLNAAMACFNELRVWSSVQSLDQMQANWQARITEPQDGLIGVWGLDRGSFASRAGTGRGGWSDGLTFAPPNLALAAGPIGWAPSASSAPADEAQFRARRQPRLGAPASRAG
jgi:Concanavalin A-like lectin/glucanases superfamily